MCVFKKYYLKDNDKTSHWVGHSKLKPQDLDYFYKGKIIINKLEDSLTKNTIEESDYGMKNILDLSIVAEVKNADAYLAADSIKMN